MNRNSLGNDNRRIINLSITELNKWLEKGVQFTLLDLRDEEDYEAAHLERAEYFSTRFIEDAAEAIPQHQPVITICYRGHRSLQAAQYLTENYPHLPVYHVAAGMDGWKAQWGQKYLVQE